MLLKRIITASILAALIATAVFTLPSGYFSLLLGILTLVAAWEWLYLIDVQSIGKRLLFLLALIVPMLGLHFWTQFLELLAQWTKWPEIRFYSGILEWLVIPPILFWIVVMISIRNLPNTVLKLQLKLRYKALIGWFILLACWMFLTRLRAFYEPPMTMYFLVLIWAADISAYFVGKKYGKTKLAPDISPGKTVAGFYGALGAGLVCAIVLSLSYGFNYVVAADFALLSMLTVLISIYGDLFFSVVKRQRGVKDSGSILPGHGGILDRVDSIIAAIPLFYAGIFLIYGLI
ncbi:MAG: phosphatidate cytidylyltransferase [Methylococcaceae bacterium]|nr:phosphatidate cytidylyltransferase [Methylococcaceae bacterium]